jgi:N-acetylglucosaminyldiphosphoundecaprenol N-acetyl-beta-D-mannosaminyltransferase
VYCILGVPVDAVGISSVLRSIETAAVGKKPFFLSTPNLNFLVNSQLDSDFRESLLMSDMCLPDGMPILGIARLIGVPIRTRIPGSDIFDALKCARTSAKPLKIFLFGGPEDAAATASRALNAEAGGLYCVGSLYPGFGSVDEMSRGDIIDDINASGADFLVASLGARKGQSWLQRNHHRFLIPVRAHLGATLNFQAGTVRRAPSIMQRYGLEWLWRIKEEPYLWRRYWHDGKALLRLLFSRVLPLAIRLWWLRLGYQRGGQDLVVTWAPGHGSVTVSLSGFAVARHVDRIVSVFRDALATKKRMFVDLSETCAIDARFLGLLLMVRKQLTASGVGLIFIGLSPALESIFRLNGLGFLLVSQESA